MAGAFVGCGALRNDELGAQQAAINKTGYTPGAHSHQRAPSAGGAHDPQGWWMEVTCCAWLRTVAQSPVPDLHRDKTEA